MMLAGINSGYRIQDIFHLNLPMIMWIPQEITGRHIFMTWINPV